MTALDVAPAPDILGINDGALRRFEAGLITHLGYEVFVPKVMPQDEAGASIDGACDGTLTIPEEDLEILNRQDYFNQPFGDRQIDLLNRHFDAAIIAFYPVILDQFVRFFRGRILLRPFGLARAHTYMDACRDQLPVDFFSVLENARKRFFFAQAFPMQSAEHGIFLNRTITLPLGIPGIIKADRRKAKTGQQRRELEHFPWDYCVREWKRVLTEHVFAGAGMEAGRRRRVGVFLATGHQEGMLGIAVNQALMLKRGSEAAGEGVDVVFSHVEGEADVDSNRDLRRLNENGVPVRQTIWREISKEELQIANMYRGVETRLDAPAYAYPSDGANNFLDCDFWHIMGDPALLPLAPVRPYSLFVADCLRRDAPESSGRQSGPGYRATVRQAALVLYSAPDERNEIIQTAEIPEWKIAVSPLALTGLPERSGAGDPTPSLWNLVRQHVQ